LVEGKTARLVFENRRYISKAVREELSTGQFNVIPFNYPSPRGRARQSRRPFQFIAPPGARAAFSGTQREFEAGRALLEHERRPVRWTRCFDFNDISRVRAEYRNNAEADRLHPGTRCSCIVMLNVALGALLQLPTKTAPARSGSQRKVRMAALTTETIEKAMAQLRRQDFALAPIITDFLDKRKKRAGTLRPERLEASIQDRVLAHTKQLKGACWYAYALSIMDGYHSVLLLVDNTGRTPTIYWLDQYSPDVSDDVSTTLDQRITERTQLYWDGVKSAKSIGSDTMARLWPLRKRG
jgi:hypothetical protein